MKKIMIWDVPIRVFHWVFAFCSVGALAIALFADEDGAVFPLHMLLGISTCFFLVVRLALGVFGCRHNRFKAMLFSPWETFRYMGEVTKGTAPRYIVHNPGTSAAAIGMFLLVPFLFWTGLDSAGETGEDIHAILAYILLAFIVAHMAGMTIHTVRHGENIALSMITGFKQGPAEQSLRSSHAIIGIAVLLVSVVWMGSLFANYNAAKRTVTLPLFGNTIQIGENEQNPQQESGKGDY
jgi:cytochrome b